MVLAGVSLNADESLTASFDRVAALRPSRIALFSENWQPTYAELSAVTNRLAHAALAGGVRSGDRIAILMAPDTPAAAATVAAWKTGAFAVMLDPAHPPARLREVFADCEPAVLVTDAINESLAGDIASGACPILRFEEHSIREPADDPGIIVAPEQTASLVYTSGSTGRPKGVMNTHRQLRRCVIDNTAAMNLDAADRIANLGSLGAADAIIRLACALLHGATFCVFPLAIRGVTGLADWLERHRITVMSSQPSVFRSVIASVPDDFRFAYVRVVRLAGEPVTSHEFHLFRQHFSADARLVASLSTSEMGAVAYWSWSPRDVVPEGRLPVGRCLPEVSLLDDNGDPVAPGEIGEIVVRGRDLAAGYWRDPESTARHFTEVADGRGTRIVRVGDLGRINADGLLEYCGRKDDRIKLRGQRIEPAEIRNALDRIPGIERAIVEAIARDSYEPVLVGFVSFEKGHLWSGTDLRRALRRTLPDPLVPSAFVILDAWPLVPNGKVDREALRQLYWRRFADRPIEPPRTPTETMLAAVWAALFDLPDISRHDDFFDLGGDSLMAMMVAVRVHEATGVELDLATLIDHAELAALAQFVDSQRLVAGLPAGPSPRSAGETRAPMSPWQERIWNNARRSAASAEQMANQIYRIKGPLDVELLRACMEEVTQRHEMLRTTFASRFGRAVQIVHAAGPLPLPAIDLRGRQDPEAEAHAIFARETARPVNLRRGPLARFVLLRLRDNEYWLLRLSHHIICDAMSWSIYLKELTGLYERARTGAPALPPPRLQYADYAIWQRRRLDPKTAAYREVVAWWKEKLAGAPPSFRPPFRAPTRVHTAADGWALWSVAPAVSQRLHALGAEHRATRLMVRLAAFSALLAAVAGAPEVTIGLYVSLRRRAALANVFGYFTNLVSVPLRPQSAHSFGEWIATVRDEVVAVQTHGEIPFDDIMRLWGPVGRQWPTVSVIFQQNAQPTQMTFADLSLSPVELRQQQYPWGFTVSIDEHGNDQNNAFFDPRLYEPSAVRAFLDRYAHLLDVASRDPDKPLGDLLAMSEPTLAAAQ